MQIDAGDLPKSEQVDELEEFLTNRLKDVTIGREGKNLLIDDGAVSRGEIKFLVRKFLGRIGLQKTTKVIAEGDIFKIYKFEKQTE